MVSEFRNMGSDGTDNSNGDLLALDPVVAAPPKASAAKAPKRASNEIMPWKFPVTVDRSRDALLTDFGKDTLDDRYLLPGESYQDLFARVAAAYADDAGHAQRLYDHMSQLWFMPSSSA